MQGSALRDTRSPSRSTSSPICRAIRPARSSSGRFGKASGRASTVASTDGPLRRAAANAVLRIPQTPPELNKACSNFCWSDDRFGRSMAVRPIRRDRSMRAVQLSSFGSPSEVTALVDLPEPGAPGLDEALLQVEYAPIDPADLLQIRGLYGVRPNLPAVVGSEGVGRVVAIGDRVKHVAVGDRVLLPMDRPAWQELMLAPAS